MSKSQIKSLKFLLKIFEPAANWREAQTARSFLTYMHRLKGWTLVHKLNCQNNAGRIEILIFDFCQNFEKIVSKF